MTVFTFFLFGLVTGSFLNVLIYRLPVMLERAWSADLALANGQEPPKQERFNLWVPRSRCRSCGAQLTAKENIPLFSYIVQKGACSHCGAGISLRYPAVELLTAFLFAAAAFQHDSVWTAAGVSLAVSMMVALSFIDYDQMLLPDNLTYLFMWSGFAFSLSTFGLVQPDGAIIGAITGFVILWAPAKAYEFVTGRDGMGGGDLKYLAGIGAWVGPFPLIYGLIVASSLSVVAALATKYIQKDTAKHRQYPFGPFLSIGALLGLYFPPSLFHY